MAKNRYSPKQLDELLGKWSSKITRFSDKLTHLESFQNILNIALGPVISKKCRVANYRDSILIIEAASTTLATRLNYLKMDILSEFRKAGLVECSQVKIITNPEVQQRLGIREIGSNKNYAISKKKMSKETAEQLNELAKNAPKGLQEKLLKLASHASITKE